MIKRKARQVVRPQNTGMEVIGDLDSQIQPERGRVEGVPGQNTKLRTEPRWKGRMSTQTRARHLLGRWRGAFVFERKL